jgi:hypothetical protein
VIPVTTGATVTISKSFRRYLSNITEKQELKNYKKKPSSSHTGHYTNTSEHTNIKVQINQHGK